MRGEEYVVSDGTYSRVVVAETPEDAALSAVPWHSVYGLRQGVKLDVFPLREAYQFRVQYERPNSEEGPHERLRDYGEPVIVRQFQKVTGGSFQETEPHECPYCDGRGWNTVAVHDPTDPDGEPLREQEQCATCGGSGEVSRPASKQESK